MILLVYWSLILSTACYAALAVWRIAIAREHPGATYLGVAFLGMAAWSGAMLLRLPQLVAIAEVARDFGWLVYIYSTTRASEQNHDVRRGIRRFCLGLTGLMLVRLVLSIAFALIILDAETDSSLFVITLAIRWTYALIGLLFAHYLYRSTAPETGSGFRLIVVALGVLWAYDLNIFTLLVLGYRQALLLSDLRGAVLLALLPAFAIAARRKERWKLALSRQAATQSLLLFGLGGYFVAVSTATRALIWAGGHAADLAKVLVAAFFTLVILAFSFAPKLRARLKAVVVRNLFEYRYDYRSEWLRFSATIGNDAMPGVSAEERMIRSVIDITESVGGALLIVERSGSLALAATWLWPVQGMFSQSLTVDPAWLKAIADHGNILTLDEVRGAGTALSADAEVPEWLLAEHHAWAAVPLVRSGRLVGIMVLGRPRLERELDWEDFDLLKVIAQQVAVHLTDAQSQLELEEARRYEEFNRRFAFIIHDLKNLVSQLSLVSSNAAEHSANPKFQVAMAKTLENATGKMTTLLARLSTDRAPAKLNIAPVELDKLLLRLSRENRPDGAIRVAIEQQCCILADEEQLTEALGHLLTNAIEASPEDAEVFLSLTIWEETAVITVEDHGCGMSTDFIHKELFKPFSSTKANGFGIGAAEARTLILAMGGTLDVISVVGDGTRFIVKFPLVFDADGSRN